jgi:carbonic anhydrase
MIPAQEALDRLKEGNLRFVANQSAELHRTHKLVPDQEPFAVILGCSDSRVPPEIIFDQGVGDMFVIRVAGNIVTPLELGSVEFAAIKFGPRLVVVLSHSKCGAVQETVESIQRDQTSGLSAGMEIIVAHIGKSVNLSSNTNLDETVNQTIQANLKNSVRQLRCDSSVLKDLVANDGMIIVGAHYSIETGVVEFTDSLAHA